MKVIILVTSSFELIECENSDISNYLNLSCHCQDIQSVNSEDVDFDPVFLDRDSVLYVLRIKSTLFGCSRSKSQLKLLKVLNSVRTFKPNIDDDGEISVEVTFDNGVKQSTTFGDDKVEKFLSSRHSEKFSGLFEAARNKTNSAKAKLADVTSEIAVLDAKISEGSKCLPKAMLEDDPNERSPMVKYGSIWTRVVNDKLVIGIPLFCASKR